MLLGGHRGNPDEYPENTLASFRSAIELGVDVIECDVHRSEDGGLPVIHDHMLDRTTDGSGLVRDCTMAELKRFDAGSWKDPSFKGERIPSLDEVLGVARGRVEAPEMESPEELRARARAKARAREKARAPATDWRARISPLLPFPRGRHLRFVSLRLR